jgi:hypothetical protein
MARADNCDHMVVWFNMQKVLINIKVISSNLAYWLMTGMWVPYNTLASSTSKPDRHGVDMILLSVVREP